MKGFVYLLIFLILALLFENIFKKWNIIEGLDCAPKENSLSYNNQAKAKAQQNEIEELKNKIKGFQPKINYTNAQKLQNVADGKDNDNGKACKKYPEAC